jgi:rubrerythrin
MSDEQTFFSAAMELGAMDALDVPALQLLYKLECSGEDFYNGLADRIGNDEAAELLRRNGREEVGHARRVQEAIGIRLGEPFEPSGEMLERFAVPLPDTISAELLPAVVQGELDGDAGYQRWADNEADPEVATLLRRNGREETQHGKRVSQVIAILSEAS